MLARRGSVRSPVGVRRRHGSKKQKRNDPALRIVEQPGDQGLPPACLYARLEGCDPFRALLAATARSSPRAISRDISGDISGDILALSASDNRSGTQERPYARVYARVHVRVHVRVHMRTGLPPVGVSTKVERDH